MSDAFHVYGAGGRKILVQTPDLPAELVAKAPHVMPAELERMMAETIAKRVRSRAVSVSSIQDRDRGKQKPTPVTYETLRLMAARNEWVRAIVSIRKRQISGVKFDVTLKDTDDPSGAARKAARMLKKLFTHPTMHGSRVQTLHWEQWIGMLLEDLLILDRMCIEKERDGNGWPVALYPVDGSTVRPNLDDKGGFYRDAYVQVVDGIKVCEFPMEDMVCAIYNPTTDVRLAGYGYSPLETLIVSVTADLHAAKFNADYFEKGAIPEGVLSLGEDIDPESLDAFRQFWATEVAGRGWSLPIIGGSKDPDFIKWRDTNRDMQFMEYQDWLLQKMCAVFEISKEEVGSIEDVNRSTAEVQDTQQQRKGITPLLSFVKNLFDLEVIGEHGAGLGDYLEFSWEEVGETAEQINAKFQVPVGAGAATRKEWREALGLDEAQEGTPGAEGLAMHLADGQPQPLPSSQDVKVMGAHAEQSREDEQTQQQQEHEAGQADAQRKHELATKDGEGGQPAQVPWQPADGDHPDVKQAMADHDRDQGIGPRNVGKTHPLDHDRHPALTDRADDLDDVFTRATTQLIAGLTEALNA